MADKFNDKASFGPEKVEDDPFQELFADCKTAEEVLELQRDIERAFK